MLKQHGIICSMSRRGNCWDNAVMERFFLNLKMERVWQRENDFRTGFLADFQPSRLTGCGCQETARFPHEPAAPPRAQSQIMGSPHDLYKIVR